MSSILRYLLATVGPAGSAGAQFALSLVLVRTLSQDDFGRFSFLMVAAQFSWGLVSALFCSPLPILLSADTPGMRDRSRRSISSVNLLGAAAAFLPFLGTAIWLDLSGPAAFLFACFAVVAVLRWYARAHAYAMGEPSRTVISDIVFCCIVMAQAVVAVLLPGTGLAFDFGGLLLASALALIPFGRSYLVEQFFHLSLTAIRDYGLVWKYSSWSLLGVLTTEATVNCHAYIVICFYGPDGFAPIAASSLMIRPINVAINALSEFERPRIARELGAGRLAAALGATRAFRWVLLAGWVGTAALAALTFHLWPRAIFPARYDLSVMMIGTVLWIAVALMRLLRAPESTLMQAAGAFRPLAFASVYSAGVSIVAVSATLLAFGPLWSILGIMVGEMLYAWLTYAGAQRWRRRGRAPVQGPPVPGGDRLACGTETT